MRGALLRSWIAVLLCLASAHAAAITVAGRPATNAAPPALQFLSPIASEEAVADIHLGPARELDIEKAKAEVASPARLIGISRPLTRPIASQDLSWITLADGSAIAHLRVTSEGAKSVRLGFLSRVDAGTEVRFRASGGKAELTRATLLESGSRASDGLVWGPMVRGDSVEAEVRLPAGVDRTRELFSISEVSHAFADVVGMKSLGDAAACQRDVSCFTLSDTARNNATSVAIVSYVSGGKSFSCTGTLMNTSPFSGIPYFITDSVCITSAQDAATVNTYWKYEATSCGSGTLGTYVQRSGGATLLARSETDHYALLQLSDPPPPGTYYSGWTTNTVPVGSAVTSVHHPRVDLKKMNVGVVDLNTPRIRAHFTTGLMEAGSAGAGVFYQDQYWAGILAGTDPVSCSNASTGRNDFAPLGAFWDNVKQWLQPPAVASGNYSDIWWNPNESGWGLTIADHETQLFAVWYTYDTSGRPTWYVVPGGTFSQGKRLFTGDAFVASGPPYNAATFDPARVSLAKVGTITLDFAPSGASTGSATFTYQVNGTTQTKTIQRQPFGSGSTAWKSDFTDIWFDPKESGWGMTLAQHGGQLFGVLFTYGPDSRPLWVVMPGVTFYGSNRFSGSLFTATGPSYTNPTFNPAQVTVTPAGSGSVRFQGDSAILGLTINGSTLTKAIQRQTFGQSSGPACNASSGVCIASTSASTVAPLGSLTVYGAGFDPVGGAISLRFITAEGRQIEMPASFATPTSVTARVPPMLDASGNSLDTTVRVQAIQLSGSTVQVSNLVDSVRITALPTVNSPPGALTATLLRAAVNVSAALQATGRFPGTSGALATYDAHASSLISGIDAVTSNSAATVPVPLADGSTVQLRAADLRLSDRLAQAAVNAIAAEAGLKQVAKSYQDCPVSANDPVAFDTASCQLQRAAQNFDRNLASTTVQEGFFGLLIGPVLGESLGAIPFVGKAVGGMLGAFATPFMVSGLLSGEWRPDAPKITESMADELLNQITGVSLAPTILVRDALQVAWKGATEFAPGPVVLSHSLIWGDGAGNSFLISSDGTRLVRVPQSQGSFDSTSLVVNHTPNTCAYVYSPWSACQPNNTQSRTLISSGPPGCTGTPVLSQSCTYVPPPNNPVAITVLSLPAATAGQSYSQQVATASGGSAPYRFQQSGGNLPPGLSLSNSAILAGIPSTSITTATNYSFGICVFDASSASSCGQASITVNPQQQSSGPGQCEGLFDSPRACKACKTDADCDGGNYCFTIIRPAPFCDGPP